MKTNTISLANSYCFDRIINNNFIQPSDTNNRNELNKNLEIFRYPFNYFSQYNRQDRQLVFTIQRGNQLTTPKLYAELAIFFMCNNYNKT
jgi:hypothetical protein